jgi:hypothetical protein
MGVKRRLLPYDWRCLRHSAETNIASQKGGWQVEVGENYTMNFIETSMYNTVHQ